MARSWQRIAGAGSVSAGGLVTTGITGQYLLTRSPPVVGGLLAGFGLVLGVLLLAAGYLVYRAGFTPRQTLRIGGWHLLGILVLSAAVALLYAYQTAVGSVPPAPLMSGTVLVAISAVAHVLIGYNDVRRIRADTLARERQKLAVLNRLVRHNLRTHAQLIYGHVDRIRSNLSDADTVADALDRTKAVGDELAEMYDDIHLVQEIVERQATTPSSRRLSAVIEGVVEEKRTEFPNATITATVPDATTVRAGEKLEHAVGEVIENAIVHNDAEDPDVELSVRRSNGWIDLVVTDNGPGIPATERAVVTGDRPITQLEHGSGLGLWLVRWVLEAYDGELLFGEQSEAGGTVILRLRAA